MRSQPTNKYPYTTIDDDGKTPVVVMTIDQANAINRKFKELQLEYSNLEIEHIILKQITEQQGDTIVQQLYIIREQRKKLLLVPEK